VTLGVMGGQQIGRISIALVHGRGIRERCSRLHA
jgi:hypothetical protein